MLGKAIYYGVKMNQKIVYIGCSEKFLREMMKSTQTQVIGVITRPGLLPESLLADLEKQGVPFKIVHNKTELAEAMAVFGNQVYVMHAFDLIIPAQLAQIYQIINIHSGSLQTNRGRHPLVWSLLLGDKDMILSVHKISGEIDQGDLIAEILVPIEAEDDYVSLRNKVHLQWPRIEDVILRYLCGELKAQKAPEGIYRDRVTEPDFTIDTERDSSDIIVRKIKSQRGYRGAIIRIGNLKLFVKDWEEV